LYPNNTLEEEIEEEEEMKEILQFFIKREELSEI